MKRIYISGAIGADDHGRIIRIAPAIAAAERLLSAGLWVYVPHLFPLAGLGRSVTYETWMRWCLYEVEMSDAVLRVPGASPGADRETKCALELGMKVWTDEWALIDWSRSDDGLWHDPSPCLLDRADVEHGGGEADDR